MAQTPLPSQVEIGFDLFKRDLQSAGAHMLAETDRSVSAEFYAAGQENIIGGKSVVADVFIYESAKVVWNEGSSFHKGTEKMAHPWCIMLTFLDQSGHPLGRPTVSDFPAESEIEQFRQFCLGALKGEMAIRLKGNKAVETVKLSLKPAPAALEAAKHRKLRPGPMKMVDLERLGAAEERRRRRAAKV